MIIETPELAGPPAPVPKHLLRGLTTAMILRLVGGVALMLALAQFLLNGVEVQNDLERFGLLLLQTGAFAGAAIAVRRIFHDLSSARLLFGLALLSVPVGFTVLGALLYSTAPLDGIGWLGSSGVLRSGDGYPDYAHWQAAGATQILVASLGALIVLVPTAAFAHAVFARRSALRLTLWLIAACLVLLVPVRDPTLTGLLAGASAIGLVIAVRRLSGADPSLATHEGRFALAVLAVPAVIVIMRTLLMYQPELPFLLSVTSALYLGCRYAMRHAGVGAMTTRVLHPVALLTGAALSIELMILIEPRLDQLAFVVPPFVGVALALDLRRIAVAGRLVACLESMLMLFALMAVSFAVLLGMDALWGLLSVIPILAFALYVGRTWLAALAGIAMFGLLATLFDDAWLLMRQYGWQSSIAVGLASVLAAAILERFGLPSRRIRRVSNVDDVDLPVEDASPAPDEAARRLGLAA